MPSSADSNDDLPPTTISPSPSSTTPTISPKTSPVSQKIKAPAPPAAPPTSSSSPLPTISQIQQLADRHPFTESELYPLLQCHSTLFTSKSSPPSSLLPTLASRLSPSTTTTNNKIGDFSSPPLSSSSSFDEAQFTLRQSHITTICHTILPPSFSTQLFTVIMTRQSWMLEDSTLGIFLEGVADLSGRRGPRTALKVIFDCCRRKRGDDARVDAGVLIDYCVRFVASVRLLRVREGMSGMEDGEGLMVEAERTGLVASLVGSKNDTTNKGEEEGCGGDNEVDFETVWKWADDVAPMISWSLSTLINELLFSPTTDVSSSPSRGGVPFVYPIRYESSDFFDDKEWLLFTLSCMDDNLGGKWQRLYSFDADGSSFHYLSHAILGYSGPTLVVIETAEGSILGAVVTGGTTWREGANFYGSGDSFIFQLYPSVKVFRPTGLESNYIYLNTTSRYTTTKQLHGLGFGGWPHRPRLFLTESFENCRADYFDKTYTTGNFDPPSLMIGFNVLNLEVWGTGGDERIRDGLKDRALYRDINEAHLKRTRVVQDKSQFLSHFRSGLMDSKLYAHREQARGRAEFKVDDERGGYRIDRNHANGGAKSPPTAERNLSWNKL